MFNREKTVSKPRKYSVGQIVQLKSGGPKMTVSYIFNDPPPPYRPYRCDWFTWNDELKREDFVEEELCVLEENKEN